MARLHSPTRHGSTIPIENIYYLLCYAWDALDEADAIDVRPEQSLTIIDLFARVLIGGTTTLLSRGINHDYQLQQTTVSGIRGKLDLAATVRGVTWTYGRTVCAVDDRSVDITHNQLIKATLRYLAAVPTLAPDLAAAAAELCHRLTDVRDIPLSSTAFRAVRVHRNNRLYDLLVHVCRLIYENPFLDETPGTARFPDFKGTRSEMARLFEQFIHNFFAREQRVYTVRRPMIDWYDARASQADLRMLPVMRTDVVLTSRHRRIVIDTKYYEHVFQEYRGTPKLRSTHLYQILSYLTNLSAANTPNAPRPEGMLLYPAVRERFHKPYTLLGHRVVVQSVDLNQPWRSIHQELLQAIDIPLT
jgi:5-methylcytosine-specific restriction enzyme subunit McrC